MTDGLCLLSVDFCHQDKQIEFGLRRRVFTLKMNLLSPNGPQLWAFPTAALRSNGPAPEGSAWGHPRLCFWRRLLSRELSAHAERGWGYLQVWF